MRLLHTTVRHTWTWSLRLGLAGISVAVVLLLLLRLALPQLAAYRTQVEQAIGAYLQLPVQIQGITADWSGWEPVLYLDGFRLYDPDNHAQLAGFDQAVVRLNLVGSLLRGRLALRNIHLQGGRLLLQHSNGGFLGLAAQTATGPPIALQDIITWLLHIDSLDMVFAEVQIPSVDAQGTATSIFRDLRLSLRNKQGQRELGLAVNLPEPLGKSLRAAARLYAEGDDPRTWQAAFYVRGDGLVLAGWPLPVMPAAGQASLVEAWGDWQDQRITSLVGTAQFQNLVPPAAGGDLLRERMAELPRLAASFSWQREATGWRWQSDWQGMDETGAIVVSPFIDVRSEAPNDDDTGWLEGHAGNLRVQDLAALALPWLDAAHHTLVTAVSPQGRVTELAFRMRPSIRVLKSEIPTYFLAARIQDLATRPWKSMPGFTHVNGDFSMNQDGGQLHLDSRNWGVRSPLLRAGPLSGQLHGVISWRRQADQLTVESPGLEIADKILKTHLQGGLVLFDDGSSPQLDLHLNYSIADLGRVRDYLPTAILHPHLVRWVDQAFVSGRVHSGELTLQGRLADFPFDNGQGLFESRFQIQDGILDYDTHWPRIEELEAEVVFHNRAFSATAVAGKILTADVERVTARVDDVDKPVLEINGRARGTGSTLLRVVQESPLARRLGNYVSGIQATGDTNLQLTLHIPLDPRPIQTRGTVEFTGGSLNLPGAELSHMRGNLDFSDQGLTATDIRLVFRGEPARLDVTTQEQGNRDTVNFRLHAPLSLAALLGPNTGDFAACAEGKGRWNLVLAVPVTPPDTSPEFELTASSDLEGIALKLPPPLGKSAAEKRALQLHTRIVGRDAPLQLWVDYEPKVHAVAELTGSPAQLRFKRGELRLNAGPAHLPESAGLAIVANLPRYELTRQGRGLPPWLNSIEARLDHLVLGAFTLPRVKLDAKRQQDMLTVTLDGDTVKGRMSLPFASNTGTPLQVILQTLALQRNEQQGQDDDTPPDPRTLPPLQLTVENLSLEGKPLGRLQLSTVRQSNGLRLTDLSLHSQLHTLIASGDWLVTEQGQWSRLQAGISSADLGKTLQALGYEPGLEGAKTSADLTVRWPGSLLAFAPDRLRGQLDFETGPGRLLNVDPGVGRVVGLLNFNTMARRLRLDFSDLYGQGLSFDRIKGDFSFADGQAHTDALTLEGPSFHIRIKGRIGLKERDYDQTITVTPKVGNPLTIAGTIAGGPPVGAAAFLVEQLLKPGIERVTRHSYTLSGSWDNPVIQAEQAEPRAQPASQGDR